MALSRSSRYTGNSGTYYGTGAWTTSSFTPSNNSLLVAIAGLIENAGTTDPSGALTVTDSAGLTWTARANAGAATTWATGIRVWTAPVTTGASMTVSFDCGTRNSYQYFGAIFDYTGYDSGSPVGVTGSDGAIAFDGADSITLSGTPAADSEVIGAIYKDNGGTSTEGTGWTELADIINGNQSMYVQSIVGLGSTSVPWVDTSEPTATKIVGVAVEIKAGAAASAPKRSLLLGIG